MPRLADWLTKLNGAVSLLSIRDTRWRDAYRELRGFPPVGACSDGERCLPVVGAFATDSIETLPALLVQCRLHAFSERHGIGVIGSRS